MLGNGGRGGAKNNGGSVENLIRFSLEMETAVSQ
jgi:hypothetical protein